MNFGGGFGKFPTTYSSGFTKVQPGFSSYSKGVPFGKGGFNKGFGKAPFAKGFGGKTPFAKGFSKGYPGTLSTGYNTAVPSTTVVTGPSKGGFGKI